MSDDRTYTVADIARRLGVPQHRLIHLCEKGAVLPDVHGAAGRGSSRLFSARNVLELAVALRLRDMMLPVSAVSAVLYVLRALEARLQKDLGAFALAESLNAPHAPDVRVIIGDGQTVYLSLGSPGKEPRLFGGIPLDQLQGDHADRKVRLMPYEPRRRPGNGVRHVGGPEQSHFARLELSVTAVAQVLPLD